MKGARIGTPLPVARIVPPGSRETVLMSTVPLHPAPVALQVPWSEIAVARRLTSFRF